MAKQFMVVVNRLNKRSAIPADLADKRTVIGEVGRGFQFEGTEVTGIPGTAPGKWLRDRDGFFYWGGGLTAMLPEFDRIPEIKIISAALSSQTTSISSITSQKSPVTQVSLVSQISQITQVAQAPQVANVSPIPSLPPSPDYDPADYFNLPFIPGKMSWAHDYLHIPQIWKDYRTAGKDVIVALIDTGLDVLHPDLKEAILPQSAGIDASDIIDDHSDPARRLEDQSGHGTAMAGILAGRGISQLYGIAPQCKLLIIKIPDGQNGQAVSHAFHWLSQQTQVSVDLITVGIALDQDLDELKMNVQACLDKGMAVFAPVGDNHRVARNDADVYPACYPDCTAIGSFGSSGELCAFSNWNPRLSLIAPGDQNLLINGFGNSRTKSGQTAFATAIAAGSFALLIACLKQLPGSLYSGRSLDYIQDLYLAAEPLQKFIPGEETSGQATTRDPMYGYGRLNLQKAITAVKKKG